MLDSETATHIGCASREKNDINPGMRKQCNIRHIAITFVASHLNYSFRTGIPNVIASDNGTICSRTDKGVRKRRRGAQDFYQVMHNPMVVES
ncbi:hypothetical protein NPIL_108271 [Nephila pilipes]|uniref:Uncharacterized protein n=1 Tax=Nephila pilipes TaxID=299642 RepID=A0A8X6T6L7_NEPPI|nr:hypothetical protein NPIL_108271 [Nephila pilipes]